jgi:hypothetical protein
MPTVLVPLYVEPLTVTLHAFEAVELMSPFELATSWRLQPTTDWLLITLWLTVHQLKTSVSYAVTVTDLLPLDAIV